MTSQQNAQRIDFEQTWKNAIKQAQSEIDDRRIREPHTVHENATVLADRRYPGLRQRAMAQRCKDLGDAEQALNWIEQAEFAEGRR